MLGDHHYCRLLCPTGQWLPPYSMPEKSKGCVSVWNSYSSLNGLLFVEKLDWERVKKLGGKFLQLRLEDAARRYPGTLNREGQSRPDVQRHRHWSGRHVGCTSWHLGSARVTGDVLAVTRVEG
ncbi:hypothetical protein V8E52_003011 [Russula decolorans]|jgi:hypothetical protein